MNDPLDAQFEDLTKLVDRQQRTADLYNRAVALFAFIAGGVFVLLILEAIRWATFFKASKACTGS